MSKDELIVTTAKEVFLALMNKHNVDVPTVPVKETNREHQELNLPVIDKMFKGIIKTVTEAYDIAEGKKD
jgi:hypothetical protein